MLKQESHKLKPTGHDAVSCNFAATAHKVEEGARRRKAKNTNAVVATTFTRRLLPVSAVAEAASMATSMELIRRALNTPIARNKEVTSSKTAACSTFWRAKSSSMELRI